MSALLGALVALALLAAACGDGEVDTEVTVYSGRTKQLVQPALDEFTKQTGIKVNVRYASTSAIVATVLEEGKNSPADVVLLQDAGALGELSRDGLLEPLPDKYLKRVDPTFRSAKGDWVGTSGRVRTVVYNTRTINPDRDLPKSVLDFTDPKWKGRIGWAPTNGSFQAFVTALRVQLGEDAARNWLQGIKANSPKAYSANVPIVVAVGSGEVDVGLVNHYYAHQVRAERGQDFPVQNYYFAKGDLGSLVNVAGVGILKTAKHQEAARRFVDYMLGKEAQSYFAAQTFEFPLVTGIPSPQGVPPLDRLEPPKIDLNKLEDLKGTLKLLRDLGIIS